MSSGRNFFGGFEWKKMLIHRSHAKKSTYIMREKNRVLRQFQSIAVAQS